MKPETYRIDNLSCANCAKTFEENVNQLPGVQSAKVNFPAAKLEVSGEVSIEAIEKAGAFDQIKIRKLNEEKQHIPFYKQKENYPVFVAAFILLMALIAKMFLNESHIIVVLLYFTTIVIGGFTLFKTGFTHLLKFKFDMNTLMTIAIIGAACIGQWQEGAVVVILFAISEALERYSMDKARASIGALMDLAPKKSTVINGEIEQVMLIQDIQKGEVIRVKPGEQIGLDGVIEYGSATINQSAITGESIPVEKTVGDIVYAGTLNETSVIDVKVTHSSNDTTLSKMIHLVEEAQSEKASSERFIDRFASIYTPMIILFALLVILMPPLIFNGDWHTWIYQGLAVLVVGCPCALVISTPVAITTAIGHAAKQGVLIKGGIHLETAGHIETIAFDKTGTLTKGYPTVTDYIEINPEAKRIAYALEKDSLHPLAKAIVGFVGIHSDEAITVKTLTGLGVTGNIQNATYFLGNIQLMTSKHIDLSNWIRQIEQLQAEGKTVSLLSNQQSLMAIFAMNDDLRSSSKSTVQELHQMGIETVMLTGDHHTTAKKIGDAIQIQQVIADVLPEEKLKVIQTIQKHKRVAMVGDGINDAPALATATLGIAVGSGTDVALETADIALMSDHIEKIPYTIKLSKKTLTVIKQNIIFALLIKFIALVLVIPGWLTLWIAIFSDIGATLIVTLNSLRLMKMKIK